jgi:hypothetical protein
MEVPSQKDGNDNCLFEPAALVCAISDIVACHVL